MKSGQRRISRHLWPNLMIVPRYPKQAGKAAAPVTKPPP